MNIRLFSILGLILLTLTSYSQEANWLNLDGLKQHNSIQPGYVKVDSGLTIVLPGISASLFQSGVPIGEFLVEGSAGTFGLEFDDVIDQVEDRNIIQQELKIPILGIDFRSGDNMFSLGYAIRAQSTVVYSKGLVDLFHFGNAPFIGETMDLSHQLQINNAHEISFGFARQLKNISLGARVKLLSGISDLSTPENDLGLFTNPDIYQLSLVSQDGMIVNTTGVLDYNGIDDLSLNYKLVSFENFGKNLGLGFDLGINGRFDKFTFGLSIIDLGGINWSQNTREYRSATETLYEGLDLLDFFDDSNDIVVEDSLKQLLDLEESAIEYSTTLSTKIYATVGFDISKLYGLSVFFINDQLGEYSSIGLINRFKVKNQQFNLSAQLTDGNIAIGAGALFDFSPVQIILSADNILGLVKIESQNIASTRIGLNLSF